MKKVFILIAIFSLNVNAGSFITFPDANTGIKAFFSPLQKEGPKSVDKAVSSTMGSFGESVREIRKESGKDDVSISSKLKDVMVGQKQGKILNYKLEDETIRLNSQMVKRQYTVYFEGGATKTMNFVFLKPIRGQDFQLVEVKIE